VSASPAATPSAAPIVTRDVLSCVRTCMLLNAVGDNDQITGKYVTASEKLSRSGSNLSPRPAVLEQAGQPARCVTRREPTDTAACGLSGDNRPASLPATRSARRSLNRGVTTEQRGLPASQRARRHFRTQERQGKHRRRSPGGEREKQGTFRRGLRRIRASELRGTEARRVPADRRPAQRGGRRADRPGPHLRRVVTRSP
jgi:hypothetical protein